MSGQLEASLVENLCRWKQSGQPRQWVKDHGGHWNHGDWLQLLADLERSAFWPLDPAAVGGVLEDAKRRWWNLHRWLQSGQPRRWVEAHGGQWDHADWLLLLTDLAASEFWPLCPDAVAEAIEEARARWSNLQRWNQSGQARQWVKDHGGHWNHDNWLQLLADLERTGFGPMEPAAVGALLEDLRGEWEIYRRWVDCERPSRRAAVPSSRPKPASATLVPAPGPEAPEPMRRKLFQAACERVKHLLLT